MLGKLDLSAIPFSQPIPLITSLVVILVLLGVLALVTVKGWWPYLWREWITSGMAPNRIMIVPWAVKIWL